MTDEITTKRYALRTVKITGLAKGDTPENATGLLSEYGILWELSGNINNLEPQTVIRTTRFLDGEKLPTGFTTTELNWIINFGQERGLELGIVEEEITSSPSVPYIDAPLLFYHAFENDWINKTVFDDATCSARLCRMSGQLTLTIEGSTKDSVSNLEVDAWITETTKLVRDGLQHTGFEEGELNIDCEVIMGAEREVKCDPAFMRGLVALDDSVKGGEE